MSFNETKPAVKSLGVWGSVTTIVSGVSAAVAILKNFDPTLILEAKELLTMTIASFTAIAGGVMSLLGRLRQQIQPIEGLFKQQ